MPPFLPGTSASASTVTPACGSVHGCNGRHLGEKAALIDARNQPFLQALPAYFSSADNRDSVTLAGAVTGFGLATRAVRLPAGKWMCAERAKTSLGVSRLLLMPLCRATTSSHPLRFARQGGGTSIKPAKNTGLMNPWGTGLARWSCQSISSCRQGRIGASTPIMTTSAV